MVAQLLGPDGRPIDRKVLTREVAAPSITGVRQVVGGHPAQGLTPQRLASILREAEQGDAVRYLELAEQMEERDPHYLAVLGTRKRQVAQLEITVEPASDAAEDEANADLVRDFLRREELEDELFDVLDAVGKGYSVVELIWEMSERDWRPRWLEYRLPQWFGFDRADGRTLKLRGETGELQDLPPWKFITHYCKAKSGVPIRGGLARPVAWWYLFRNYSIKDWVTFLEVYGQPLRVGKYHPGADPEDRRQLLRALRNIGTDAAAMIPASMMIEFVESASTGANSQIYEAFLKYGDQLISKAVLGQTATTDAIAGGHAVGQEHNDVRGDIERSDSRQLAATLNRDLVRPLVDLNRGPQPAYPRIVIGRPEGTDVAALSTALAQLVPVGLKVRASEVRRKLSLADPEEGDELLEVGAAMPAAPWMPGGRDMARAAARRQRDPVDMLADQAEAEAGPAMDALIDQVRELVAQADSLEAVRDGLLGLYPRMAAGPLADAMRLALVMADLTGRDEIVEQG